MRSPLCPPATRGTFVGARPEVFPMIIAEKLAKRFGSLLAVDEVSFSVSPGEVLGFLGPNGAGKSTTMKMVAGFLAPTSGRASICGHDVESQPVAAKRCLGYLPEGAPSYGDMTPRSFLEFVADVRGLAGPQRRQRLDEVIERLQLGSVIEQRIETLSKGYRRRVGLAQAILHDPAVLILDEPTDGLDPNQKHEVRELIREMSPGKTIVISTHILEEVHAVCTRAIIIAAGRILADDTPAALEARSARHNAIALRLAGSPGTGGLDALAALPGVAGVEAAPDGTLILLSRDGAPILTEVGRLVIERGWQVESLGVERGQLDDVFREITRGAAG
jgi:ABC-2 type transport system ATP-binding protein